MTNFVHLSSDLAESTNLESSAKCDPQPPHGETQSAGRKNKLFIKISLATSCVGGQRESEDNEIGSDVNKEVLIGGDTDNNRWT